MSPKITLLSLLLLVTLSLPISFGSHIHNSHKSPKHENFGLMRRSYRTSKAPSNSDQATISVDDYGAKASGNDDSEAFLKAWKEACSSGSTLVVPEDKVYHLKPVKFSGPCQPNTALMLYGTIMAWSDMSAYEDDRNFWIQFVGIKNFKVDGAGKGIIDGNGKIWWQHSCKINPDQPCKDAPTAVTFSQCTNLIVQNLKFQNPQQMHMNFDQSSNVRASSLIVQAPGNSPNTDGIHVTATQNMFISNSIIGTGDDCISIVSGSRNVRATDITCGPGHGISIGSLGADDSEAEVSNVEVNRATLIGTMNGVRIKTWQGGSGYARDIKFMNIQMRNVSNPIIIDQNYCDKGKPCQQQQGSAVQLSDVVYQNIRGTSASEVAIKFDCSQTKPCTDIYVEDVYLKTQGHGGAVASCDNVRFVNRGNLVPQCS
ncbi:polygalacturonase-like isoform X1 [Neltuma alba]|uniref:polygalacturonase-like isoform X1 n=1 Tax=Neltuma alba TaxID=207710 RepID=UPI0010A4F3A0|nr:polygalacturonase-like isoform X1 [Prosopis alba]